MCSQPRELSVSERQKLENDTNVVSQFKQHKLEKDAQRNWDLFYKRNSTNFFRDRHWTTREFEELCGDRCKVDSGNKVTLLEVGCGVGNFLFPLLEGSGDFFIYACDFSPRAVQFVKENPLYDAARCCAFQSDITTDDLCQNVPENSVDLVTMIFVLSAIHPEKMKEAIENVFKVLKPGGKLLFRDYGLYDHAMLRFAPGHKIFDNFYVRQDGTRAYYFSLEKVAELMESARFKVEQCEYIHRRTVNVKEGVDVERIFVQGKFCKRDGNGENITNS